MNNIKLDTEAMKKHGDMTNRYTYQFKTGIASLEYPFLLDIDVRGKLFAALVEDFKIELYSKLHKEESKEDVIIKVHSGII